MPRRLFSTFPGGWPGIGLLLLRAVVGGTAVIQGGNYLTQSSNPTVASRIAGLLAVTSGVALIIGLFTAVTAAIVCTTAVATALSWIPAPSTNLLADVLSAIFATTVSTSIALMGPGAFSIDSRRFGRREVIIPYSPRPPRQ